jgi:hypothetical protein
MLSFRLPGWCGVLRTKPLAKQQCLPCQAGLRPHSRDANCHNVRRLTTRGLVFEIY